MHSLSTKAAMALLAAIVIIAAVIGAIYENFEQQRRTINHAAAVTGGDPLRGEAMFIQYGCGSCHSMSGVRAATGNVGPPLDTVGARVIIGGHLANRPDNMERWIRDPQHVSPGTAMPDLKVGAEDAQDITAFLYSRAK